MPFTLRKAPKRDAYWVVDPSGKHYSKDPLPKERARAQQKALYASEGGGLSQSKPDRLRDELRDLLKRRRIALTLVDDWKTIQTTRGTLSTKGEASLGNVPAEREAIKKESALAKEYGIPSWSTSTLGQLRRIAGESAESLPALNARIGELSRTLKESAVEEWGASPVVRRGLLTGGAVRRAELDPEAKRAAIAQMARARQEADLRALEGQQATQQAYERDPSTIAKRAEIASRQQSDEAFNPLLRGTMEAAKSLSSFVPSQAFQSFTGQLTDALGSQMDEEARRREARAEKEALGRQYSEQTASDIQRLRSRLTGGRFGMPQYFGEDGRVPPPLYSEQS